MMLRRPWLTLSVEERERCVASVGRVSARSLLRSLRSRGDVGCPSSAATVFGKFDIGERAQSVLSPCAASVS